MVLRCTAALRMHALWCVKARGMRAFGYLRTHTQCGARHSRICSLIQNFAHAYIGVSVCVYMRVHPFLGVSPRIMLQTIDREGGLMDSYLSSKIAMCVAR